LLIQEESSSAGADLPDRGSRFETVPAGASPSDWEPMGEVRVAGSCDPTFPLKLKHCGDQARSVVVVQIDGRSLLRQNGRQAPMATGDLYLLANGVPVEIESVGEAHHAALTLPSARLDRGCPGWSRLVASSLPGDRGSAALLSSFVRHLAQRRYTLETESRPTLGEAAIYLLVATLIEHLRERPDATAAASSNSRLESYHRARIKDFARTHLRDPDLDIAAIAEGVNLSPRYVHKLFENETMGLMQWVWDQRLANCYRELSHLSQQTGNRRSIGSIAYSWGFSDQAHFSRAFRQRFDRSPREVANAPSASHV
jgi:AraC family transcriptional regulator, positive regulator of tynA and feaB